MLTQIINGKIFTPQGWLDEGSVLIRDNKILEVTNCDLALIGAKLIDAKGMYIVPGYVCMHAHGGGGHDFNECTAAVSTPCPFACGFAIPPYFPNTTGLFSSPQHERKSFSLETWGDQYFPNTLSSPFNINSLD